MNDPEMTATTASYNDDPAGAAGAATTLYRGHSPLSQVLYCTIISINTPTHMHTSYIDNKQYCLFRGIVDKSSPLISLDNQQ